MSRRDGDRRRARNRRPPGRPRPVHHRAARQSEDRQAQSWQLPESRATTGRLATADDLSPILDS